MKSPFKLLAVAVAGTSLLAMAPALAAAQQPVVAVPIAAPIAVAAPISAKLPASTQAVKIADKVIEENSDLIEANIKLPVLSGMLDVAYQDKLNAAIEKKATDLLASLKKQSAENAEDAKKFDYPARPYAMELSYELKSDGSAASGGILSFTVSTYTYTGGAHGGTFVAGYTVANEQQASDVTLTKALGDGGTAAANRAVRYAIQHDPDRYFPDAMETFGGVASDTSFYVNQGIVNLVFQQYDLAPYAGGIIEIPVDKKTTLGPSIALIRSELKTGANGESLVPLRKVAEALGYKLTWVPKTRTATLSRDGARTQLTIGVNSYSLNGSTPIKLLSAPKLIQGTTYVPDALFSRILGLSATTGADGSLTIRG
ncbi:PdaC/SigV domain-containing protein [Cohnella sp. GCM10027633]|uniref:PdaC/SigV domain-containing protein n=1 Tax=unclassified Cohnella TaxID=2636738 RepID=UPI003641006F